MSNSKNSGIKQQRPSIAANTKPSEDAKRLLHGQRYYSFKSKIRLLCDI